MGLETIHRTGMSLCSRMFVRLGRALHHMCMVHMVIVAYLDCGLSHHISIATTAPLHMGG